MSNLPSTIGNAALPAHLAKRAAAVAAAADAFITGVGSQGPRISLRGRRFRLKHPELEAEHVLPEGAPLNVILVGADPIRGSAKVYYMGEYEPDSSDPPDCSSADGVKPDGWIQHPQAPTCAQCPHNAWGTAKRGRGKACRDVKRIYVLPPNQLEGDIYQIQVPPSSLKHLSGYVRELKAHNVAPQYVVSKISFVDAEYPEIKFEFAGFLDEPSCVKVDGRQDDVVSAISRGQSSAEQPDEADDAAPAPAAPAPAAPAAAPNWTGGAANTGFAPQPATASAPAPAPAPATPARRRRSSAPQPTAPAAPAPVQEVKDESLSKILGDWATPAA